MSVMKVMGPYKEDMENEPAKAQDDGARDGNGEEPSTDAVGLAPSSGPDDNGPDQRSCLASHLFRLRARPRKMQCQQGAVVHNRQRGVGKNGPMLPLECRARCWKRVYAANGALRASD
jgi:hypothetical protein